VAFQVQRRSGDDETLLPLYRTDEFADEGIPELQDASAVATDEVLVLSPVACLVVLAALPQLALINETQVAKALQIPVHRREAHRVAATAGAPVQLFGIYVAAGVAEQVQEHPALCRQRESGGLAVVANISHSDFILAGGA
jgi:hypothetical protein